MKLSEVEWIPVAKAVYHEYNNDDVPGLAAEMAYNFIFAVFPFIIFLATLTGLVGHVIGQDKLFDQIMNNLYQALPSASAESLRGPLN